VTAEVEAVLDQVTELFMPRYQMSAYEKGRMAVIAHDAQNDGTISEANLAWVRGLAANPKQGMKESAPPLELFCRSHIDELSLEPTRPA
jgi:hypothetical protein